MSAEPRRWKGWSQGKEGVWEGEGGGARGEAEVTAINRLRG